MNQTNEKQNTDKSDKWNIFDDTMEFVRLYMICMTLNMLFILYEWKKIKTSSQYMHTVKV